MDFMEVDLSSWGPVESWEKEPMSLEPSGAVSPSQSCSASAPALP